jgi:hypothetical protein
MGGDMAELLDELVTTCNMCGRLHIDCDMCPCVLRLGYWVIDGCEHCETRNRGLNPFTERQIESLDVDLLPRPDANQ